MAADWSLNQVLAQLDSGRKWSANTITYGFPAGSSGIFSQGEAAGFRAVNAAQQALMVLAIATWDELIPQGFAPGAPGTTHIEFAYTSTSIGYAHAYYPPNGSVYFNATESSLVSTALGEYGFQTFVHEIGHALGLNHMGDYNGDGNWSPSSYQDSVVLSIMSYFGPRNAAPNFSAAVMQADWVGADGRIRSPQTPMVNDVLAIQAIYGVSGQTRVGDTVYGFNGNAAGPTAGIYDFTFNPYPVLTIFDSAGFDTLDLSGWISPSRVDLSPGAYSSTNEMTNNIAIAYSAVIEAAIGGANNDELIGNSAGNRLVGNAGDDRLIGLEGDDVLEGGPGNDLLDGGPGNDSAIFEGAFAGYSITVNGSAVTLVSSAGGSDRATGIELFRFADVLRSLGELAGSASTDTTAPTVRSLSPGAGSIGVAVGTHLVVSFSEAVKAGTGQLTIHDSDGTVWRRIDVADTRQIGISGSTVTIDPTVDLTAGRSYRVAWETGAFVDMAGNPAPALAAGSAWSFSTGTSDARPPSLISLSPADDATGIAAQSDLVMQFDESVVAGSGSLILRAGNQVLRTIAVNDAAQVRIQGSVVTIDPAVDLPAGALITVTVEPGSLRDQAGNGFGGIASATAWNFTTAAAVTDDFPYSTETTGIVLIGGAASTGRIEVGGDRDLFRVVLAAGQAYVFTLERGLSGLSDPFLTLWSPALQLLEQDDDSAGAGNARIGFTPAASGTYYLGVQDYSGTGVGVYALRASLGDARPPTVQGLVPADDAAQVSVAADLALAFDEAVQAGSGSIRLLNSAGAVLREIRVDDASAVRMAGNVVTVDPGANLPAGTVITVQVDAGAFVDLAGNPFAGIPGTGQWNFTTAAVGADDYPMSVSTPGRVLVNGAPATGRIDFPDDGDLFRVTLTAGVTYQFDLVSSLGSAIDPYLMLFGTLPEVELIRYDDDGGPRPLDSRLFFTPSIGGDYFLAAFDYAESVGRYSLSAITPADDFVGSTATRGRVVIGSTATSGRIEVPSDVDIFAVNLTGGQQYSFELRSAADSGLADPYLMLLAPDETPLLVDDDTGIGLDAWLTITAPSTGTYYLVATDFDVGIGDYRVDGYQRLVITGTARDDNLHGGSLRETLDGGGGHDSLRGGPGDDILNGGDGIDTGRYAGPMDGYYLENMGERWIVRDLVGTEGRDLIHGVERLRFDDGSRALDLDGAAGITAAILGAIFGPVSIDNRVYVGIGLSLLDNGMQTPALVQLALDARLGAGARPPAVVELLYANLFGQPPDAATRQFYVDLITSGVYSPAGLAWAAAESEWNLANIDLTGLAEVGLGYQPWVG